VQYELTLVKHVYVAAQLCVCTKCTGTAASNTIFKCCIDCVFALRVPLVACAQGVPLTVIDMYAELSDIKIVLILLHVQEVVVQRIVLYWVL
jgi:hypothetical protein